MLGFDYQLNLDIEMMSPLVHDFSLPIVEVDGMCLHSMNYRQQ